MAVYTTGKAVFGTGSFQTTYANGQLDFGVKGDISSGRIFLQSRYIEIGHYDNWAGNAYSKGSVTQYKDSYGNSDVSTRSLYAQYGIWIGAGNGRGLHLIGDYTNQAAVIGDAPMGGRSTATRTGLLLATARKDNHPISFEVASGSANETTTNGAVSSGKTITMTTAVASIPIVVGDKVFAV